MMDKRQWVEVDADRVRSPDRWPNTVLHMKSAPWSALGPARDFGYVTREQPTVVRSKTSNPVGKVVGTFGSVEEMLETWVID